MIRTAALRAAAPWLLAATLAWAMPARAQFDAAPTPDELVQVRVAPVTIAPGRTQVVDVVLRIKAGWHINANPAANENAIPTELVIASARGYRIGAPVYPPPKVERLSFDPEPLLVWDGTVTIKVPVTADAGGAVRGAELGGKVSFQACNDEVCLAPASVPFELGLHGGEGASAAAPDSAAAGGPPAPADSAALAAGPLPDSASFATAPPAGTRSAALDNPIARKLESGGWIAYLTLFLIGLALNLTPCVYPMLGVTVSIFGARRKAPPLQVFGAALLYVIGMAITYSTLGVVAALTGGLFGSFLQSPLVLIGIGALMLALSLSMFGLYELQPPAWLMAKLGGAGGTSAIGIFVSGLVVGVFAAPCVGPPVVALLAVVGAKGDPWFGFSTFFTLALGLGFPYLLLGTFSGLLQSLPRSGDWMEWVKKVFGVILVAVGLFYVLLALAPKQAVLVIPVALAAGGLYLGFLEKSAANRRGFQWLKRVVGVGALALAVYLFAGMRATGLAFTAATPDAVDAELRAGRVVMVDFSADWCVPCHELENVTFTDRRVIAAARDFRAFKVDLTRYASPEAERWRKRYGINGVPTVVFLSAAGEVRAARVEGFLPPERFLERMSLARAGGAGAALE